jgi:hypothetical protein
MWMPWKTREVIFRILIPKIIEEQKRIKIVGFTEAEGAP